MWTAQSDSRLFSIVLLALVGVAWLALAAWGASPHGSLVDHERLKDVHQLNLSYAWTALLFVAGWGLMTVAMMLPTSLPLVLLFRMVTRQRRHRQLLTALLIVGYLVAWLGFGLVAHVADFGVHRLVESNRWLHANTWLLGAAPLLIAGAYQFTPLKYMCLDKCRSPYSFVIAHWQGGDERFQALRLGLDHGVFCVGCCWSLMLLMFAVGIGNLVWMLGLASVMAIEKNMPWGRRLSAPVGAVFLSAGLTVVGLNLGLS